MFVCCRAERHRAALAKCFHDHIFQHATAADTREYTELYNLIIIIIKNNSVISRS